MALLFWARAGILSAPMWCRAQDRDTFRPAAAPLVSSPSLWICHYSGSVHPEAPVLELRFGFLQCLWSPRWTFVKSNLGLSLQAAPLFLLQNKHTNIGHFWNLSAEQMWVNLGSLEYSLQHLSTWIGFCEYNICSNALVATPSSQS